MLPVPALHELKFDNKDLSKSKSSELEEGEALSFFSSEILHFWPSSLSEVAIVFGLASMPLESKESPTLLMLKKIVIDVGLLYA